MCRELLTSSEGALIAALTFLLAFRANFSYNRWWESVSAVHQMHSKWLDVGTETASFHLQCSRYTKPPAFGSHPELTCLVERERERLNAITLEQLEEKLDQHAEDSNIQGSPQKKKFGVFRRKGRKTKTTDDDKSAKPKSDAGATNSDTTSPVGESIEDKHEKFITQQLGEEYRHYHRMKQQKKKSRHRYTGKSINAAKPKGTGFGADIFRQVFNRPAVLERGASATLKIVSKNESWNEGKPPLFLQESAHLLSLLSAVALSTLRNDLAEADSPLITFTPGAPWPHVDPDDYGADVRKEWSDSTNRHLTVFRYILGFSRTPKMRTLYNAARPFRVIGGVSDAEIELLQAARGPLAKVALVSFWFQEFISREYLAGSTGAVAPPIISRLYQFISDGMIGYNQARKVAYIPFPFPHAQISSLFVLIACCLIPVVMLTYISNPTFGFVMNALTVMCFCGLHEVARELESPFQNVPNDVPLNNFQAQFNEALITMFFGYHPDAFWEVVDVPEEESEHTQNDADGENKSLTDSPSKEDETDLTNHNPPAKSSSELKES